MAGDKDKPLDISTRIVHASERQGAPHGQPTVTPIYTATTFTYETMNEMDRVFAGEDAGYVYTRHGNPTIAAFECAMRDLECGAVAVAYGSGMAALHAALVACELGPGSVALASQDLYGATLNLLLTIFNAFDVRTVTCDFSNLDTLAAKARELKPKVLVA